MTTYTSAQMDGYWGYWVLLDFSWVFGYDDWQEWRYGIALRDDATGEIVDWCITAGVNYIDEGGHYNYEFVIKIPDQPETEVGKCYTPVYYDATLFSGTYVELEMGDSQYDVPGFCIGEPYRPEEAETHEINWIKAVFTYGDANRNGCASYDEMIALYEWGMQEQSVYDDFLDLYFSADTNADGLMTWSELNQWLPSVSEYLSNEQMAATQTFFKWFDLEHGNTDFGVTREEAEAGIADLASRLSFFYDEFNFYWHFFNQEHMNTVEGSDDVCVTEEELIDTMEESYRWSYLEIRSYW